MSTQHPHRMRHRREIMLSARILVVAAALAIALSAAIANAPFASSEMRFTDRSLSGFAIVPASGSSCNSSSSATVYDVCPGDACFNLDGVQGAPPGGYYLYETPGVYRNCCPDGYTADTYSCYPPAPAPTCSISLNPTSVNAGASSALSWSSANASTFYISNVSYVTPNVAGGSSVAPSVTTTYTGTVTGNGTAQCSATLTVYQPCTFAGTSIAHGVTVTGYQAETVPYGSSCLSELRTCTNGTLSGTYGHANCSVTPAANCSLDNVTVTHSDSRTFYSAQVSTGGALCSSYAQSRSCTNGTLGGSASYQYAQCSCAAAYTCSGSDIRYTNTSCNTSTVASCASPSSCSAGQSSCQWPEVGFTPNGSLSLTGHLQARPSIVSEGDTTKLYWNVANAESCTVSGGGQTWNLEASGSSGVTTNPITALTRYTLSCVAYGDNLDITESIDVLVVPDFSET